MLQPGLGRPVQHARREQDQGMPAGITLITGGRGYTYQKMHALIVDLALDGPVKVLIGGNRYDHYRVNYALAAVTSCYEYVLDQHIRLSRAETCYQMVELLAQTRADPVPILVLDLLASFYDERAPERELDQLLFEAVLELRRLSRAAAVVVSAHPDPDRPRLLEAVKKAAGRVEGPQAPSLQPVRQPALLG
jgi:hypothetical protein